MLLHVRATADVTLKKLLNTMLLLAGLMHPVFAHAGAAMLIEEPYGKFGGGVPMGHSAMYLPRVCAVTPTELRRCGPGELGVVISRYRHVDGLDWLAIPIIPYLYAVDRIEDVPVYVSPETVHSLRNEYRRTHLGNIVPDGADGSMPKDDWKQLMGAAYDRKIYIFHFETTEEQDDELIDIFNFSDNRERFELFYRNCADLTSQVINFYYPGATSRSVIADLGIMTPKELARGLTKYAKHHERVNLTTALIPQVPGSVARSHKLHGVVETLLRSKKYAVPLAPLAVIHPFFAAGVVVSYFYSGHFQVPKSIEVLGDPEHVQLLAERYAGWDVPDGRKMALAEGVPPKQFQNGCIQTKVGLQAQGISCFVNSPQP